MSIIYSFLQKRRMHESQHGYLMVFVAYILSALMLLMGSDLFYNINSTAAGNTADTKEETPSSLNTGLYGMKSNLYTAQLTVTGIINPYGLAEGKSEKTGSGSSESISTSGDTVWLFGNAMDGETFDSLVQQIGSIKPAKQKDKASVKSLSYKKTVSSEYGNISNNEVKMLERIVEAEASGEDMKGKILIVNVIMNRVADQHFPKTIKNVIFQRKSGGYQFSPVGNERYWSVNVSADTKEAVKRALKGEDYSKGALYFVARKRTSSDSMEWFDNKLDRLFKHGGHEFYKNK